MSALEPYPASPPADAPALENFDDLHLHSLAATGDSAAFAALFHRYYPAIHAFAYRLALCPGAADDIAQGTFIHAARSLATFRRDASFKNWLYAIATNLTRDLHRSRARRETREQHLALLAPDPAAAHRDHATTDSAHAAVRDALVYHENLSHAEAARVLRCAESTVSWRVFRAKSRLKNLLRDVAPIRLPPGDASSRVLDVPRPTPFLHPFSGYLCQKHPDKRAVPVKCQCLQTQPMTIRD